MVIGSLSIIEDGPGSGLERRLKFFSFESAFIKVASCVLTYIFDVFHPQPIGSLSLQGDAL